MANISQTVPNYLGGINQQADWDKAPGEVRELINGYPDLVYGLRKRPGTKYEYALDKDNEIKDGHWFPIIKEGEPPFIGVVYNNGTIRVWNNATRTECTVNNNTTYLSINNREPAGFQDNTGSKYKVINVNDITVIVNRKCKVLADGPGVGSVTGTVTSAADLPETATDGDVYYITNSTAVEDDYYVKWENSAWVETRKPNVTSTGIDADTMPHQLYKIDNNTFTFAPVLYADRAVGDDTTNKNPTFVKNYIENAFFYLNRVGFLSGSNVILSQPLRPDFVGGTQNQVVDFFVNSTLTSSAADPIDITAASTRSVTLRSVQVSYQGLTLFSDGEQFMMYSDSGVMTPQSALIKSISTFEYNGDINVQTLRDEYYFIATTQRHARVHKMRTRGLENGPIISDVSRVITDYIPNNVNNLVPNSENGFLAVTSQDSNIMYMFRRLAEADAQQQADTWFTWELAGKIQGCTFYKDKMYVILLQDGMTTITSAPLNTVPEEDILTNVPIQGSFINPIVGIGPFIDNWISSKSSIKFTVAPTTTYTDSDGEVWDVDPILTFPDTYPHNITSLTPVAVQAEDELVRSVPGQGNQDYVGFTPPVKNNGDGTWTITGTFKQSSNIQWVAGYRFAMDIHLPRYYVRRDSGYDFDAYFILNQMKFAFYEYGEVEFKMKSIGSDDWKNITPATPANYYSADTPIYQKEVIVSLGLHQRNNNYLLRIYDESPFALSLNRMMWEGRYTPKYYTRS